jgi:hypothetical protein
MFSGLNTFNESEPAKHEVKIVSSREHQQSELQIVKQEALGPPTKISKTISTGSNEIKK